MKRLLCLITALTLLLLTASCGNSDTTPTDPPASPTPLIDTSAAPTASPKPSATPKPTATPEPTPEPTAEPEFTHPLTGVPVYEDLSNKKPVAIMLNNIKAAIPMQGNSNADIIYEVLAEGGITRMMGIFLTPGDVDAPIGSVRSARPYYWELARGHDAVYVHAGGSEDFYNYKASQNAFTIDGVRGSWGDLFYRDRNRVPGQYFAVEHSLLTTGTKIAAVLEEQGLTEHKSGYVYEMNFADDATPKEGQSAKKVTASFGVKTTTFTYDEESGNYLVEEYGGPFIDANDNTQVSVKNVFVLQTACNIYDDYGRIKVDLTSGKGYFACGGKMIPITWEKNGADNQLRYKDANGNPLTLGRGKSFVCIVPLYQNVISE